MFFYLLTMLSCQELFFQFLDPDCRIQSHLTGFHVVCTHIGASQRTVITLGSLVKYSEDFEPSIAQ